MAALEAARGACLGGQGAEWTGAQARARARGGKGVADNNSGRTHEMPEGASTGSRNTSRVMGHLAGHVEQMHALEQACGGHELKDQRLPTSAQCKAERVRAAPYAQRLLSHHQCVCLS